MGRSSTCEQRDNCPTLTDQNTFPLRQPMLLISSPRFEYRCTAGCTNGALTQPVWQTPSATARSREALCHNNRTDCWPPFVGHRRVEHSPAAVGMCAAAMLDAGICSASPCDTMGTPPPTCGPRNGCGTFPPQGMTVPPHPGGNCCQVTPPPPPRGDRHHHQRTNYRRIPRRIDDRSVACCTSPKALKYTLTYRDRMVPCK